MDGDYLPITDGDANPDTQFLVHNSISRYVSKLPSMGSQARSIKLALPSRTPYVRQTVTLKMSPHIAGVAAWALSSFLPRHGAFTPPIFADTIDFPHAGDQKAVRVTVMNPLGPRPAPPPVLGNVSRWPCLIFRKFSRHMSQRSKAHSTNQDHIMHPLDRADAIIAATSSFVQAHPRPQLVQDAIDQQLADKVHRNPTSKRARQAWAHHNVTNNMKQAQRHLRRFRKCTVCGRSTFFNAL